MTEKLTAADQQRVREKAMYQIEVGPPWAGFWIGPRVEGPIRVARDAAVWTCQGRGCAEHARGEHIYPKVRVKLGRKVVAEWRDGKRVK